VPGLIYSSIFWDQPLFLHKRVVRALWRAYQQSNELHPRLKPFSGLTRDLRPADVARLGATCGLAVRDLVEDQWDPSFWSQLERASYGAQLTPTEWRELGDATADLDTDAHAHYAVRGATKRWLSTSDGAVSALATEPDPSRMLDLIVRIAELTSL
jgi:hypothetical protein